MLKDDTKMIQQRFAEYCRTGEAVELPGVNTSKMHHYRRLVFNVVKNTIDQAYPISKEIIDSETWYDMVDRFFREHDCQTPKIWMLPFEFYEFIKEKDYASELAKPFLNDLLYFEWIEIEVYTMPDEDIQEFISDGDILKDKLLINPEHRIIHLEFPVHKMSGPDSVERKGNYFVMAFREPGSGKVRFTDLSVLHVFFINKLLLELTPITDLIGDIGKQFNISDLKMIETKLSAFISDMIQQKAILGFIDD